ncbi:MAG: TIM barrel protein [Thermodesulfobacteriota bacterium]|jgi:sugar phosphate isomerase/epimerase|nr:MAG: TIM barrel protein [Thermodesulfobacteriota bacterium]
MLGLSTAWMSDSLQNDDDLFRALTDVGLDFLELEYRIPESLFLMMKPKLKNKAISIHNFFPFPQEYSHCKPSGDLFLLSSLDHEEREKAITFTIKTIQTAHDLECSAVVLHLGRVEMESGYKQFCRYFDTLQINSPEMDLFLSRKRKERTSKRQRFLDAVLFSLEKLNQEAEKQGVFLGVENRYYFHEIPDFEEFGIIFKKFAGGKIFFWHDVGHGYVQEKLGIQSHHDLLARYAPNLLGVHLHDARGYSDHQAPGKGEIDFTLIKQYVKDVALKVLELHPRVTPEEVKEGIGLLRRQGYY